MENRKKMCFFMIAMSVLLICILTGFTICKNTHAEIYIAGNNVVELDEKIYYISGRKLMIRHDNTDEDLYSYVSALQKYNDIIYFIANEENSEKNHLYAYSGDIISICDLPTGYVTKSYVYDNYLYYLINGDINMIDMRDFKNTEILIDENICDFCISNNKIFYLCCAYKNIPDSLDSYAKQVKENSDNITIDNKIYEYDLIAKETSLIYETNTNSARFILSPVSKGIVFYNPDEKKIFLYNNSLSTLYESTIISLVSKDKNIYFLKMNGDVCKLDLEINKEEKVCSGIDMIRAIIENYIYDGDGKFYIMEN